MDKFVTGRNPDLIGLVPVNKSTKDTINRMFFKLMHFSFGI